MYKISLFAIIMLMSASGFASSRSCGKVRDITLSQRNLPAGTLASVQLSSEPENRFWIKQVTFIRESSRAQAKHSDICIEADKEGTITKITQI